MRHVFLIIALLIGSATVAQTDTISIVSYNLLNFPDGRDDCSSNTLVPNRFDTLRKILGYAQPDIFVACEIQNKKGADSILTRSLNVFGKTNYAAATYHSNTTGGNLQNMLYYNTDKLVLHSQNIIETNGRDIDHYVLYALDPNLSTFYDTTFLEVYMSHLKAGSGSSQQATRNAQAVTLRNYIDARPQDRNHIFCGDLNVYRSSEAAYQTLISGGSNPLFDPINTPGSWNNNGSFASVHTQSTRTSQKLDCGSTGGSDDRFDQILVSGSLLNGSNDVEYLSGSYDAIGNDGNHFNSSLISSPTNSQYPDSLVNALYYMSDHLPVVLKAVVTYPTSNGLALNPSVTAVSCAGESDGSITITPNMGQAPYTYQWDLQAGSQTTQTIVNLTAGTYCVTVTDALLEEDDICVTVSEPTGFSTNAYQTADNGTCDGSAIVVVSGGNSPFTYQWNDAASQTTEVASDLCYGDYSVTVTDATGCQSTTEVTVGGATNALSEIVTSQLTIFPVPFDNQLTLKVSSKTKLKSILLINSIGQVLLEKTNLSILDKLVIPTNHIEPGTYFLKIETGDQFVIRQVVKR